jgi:hypothetical protein
LISARSQTDLLCNALLQARSSRGGDPLPITLGLIIVLPFAVVPLVVVAVVVLVVVVAVVFAFLAEKAWH